MRFRLIAIAVLLGTSFLVNAVPTEASTPAALDNPIVLENQQTGSSGWLPGPLIASDAIGQIKGFTSAASVSQNESITLFVTVNPAQTYTIDVYRIGWYGGTGARLRLHAGPLDGIQQSACSPDAVTGLIACAWTPSYTFTVPADWTSGVYLVHLINAQGYQNYAIFVVRDGRPASFLYQQSVATDQAYNNYPDDGSTGKSLYPYNSYGANTVAGDRRAVKVSFDRPYSGFGVGQFFEWEAQLVRWLERSGYDVTYSNDLDAHARGGLTPSAKGILFGGHSEYWSKEMFDGAEAARDAGVNLAFFGADAITWQVRFEASASSIANRVMVAYKNAAIDPVQGPTTTALWRFPPLNRPEQVLRGVMSNAGQVDFANNAGYVVTNSSHWVYEGTGFRDGDVVPGIVGYEMDHFWPDAPAPNSSDRTLLSHSPFTDDGGHADYANSSIYRAPSGAWVFATGTMSWSWGLDNLYHNLADARIQRTTANVLAAFLNGAPTAASLKVTAPPTVTAGEAFNVTVAAVNAQGNPVTSYRGTVHFGSGDSATGVVLPADSGLTAGQGTFSVTLATAGPQTLTVSDAANSLSASVNVTVTAGPADHFALATSSAPNAGTSFSFTMAALDRFGNPAVAYTGRVHFTSTDDAATLPPDSGLANGQGTFSATLTKGGPQTITATDTATASITGALAVDVAAPIVAALKVTAPPTATAGDALSVTVVAVTAQGDPVTSYSGTVHFSSSDTSSSVVLPADSALTGGSGVFSVILATAGSQTLIATDTTTATIAGQAVVNVAPAAATRLALSTIATPTAGTGFSFNVTALDRFGNTATGYTGRVHFTSSDGAATLPPDSTLTAGRATLTATLTRAGSQTITGTDAASLSGQLAVTVRAAPAVRLVLASGPSATAGAAFAFTVEARDQFGNVDAAYAGRVHYASSDSSTGVVLPADSALTNGRGTFSATLTKAGTQTISGTDLAKATITGQLSIAIVAAGAATLTLDSPSSTAAGNTFTVKVTLRDQFGNVATGYRGSVHFSTSDPLPTVRLPADYTFTASDAGSRSFSVQLWTIGGQTLTARDKNNSTLSDTNSITVRLL